jgi:hypothetical protein
MYVPMHSLELMPQVLTPLVGAAMRKGSQWSRHGGQSKWLDEMMWSSFGKEGLVVYLGRDDQYGSRY